MIATRSPLRISLGGGGTDLPSYYREHGGFLIAAAIDKYVQVALHPTTDSDLIIEHPIVREALRLLEIPAASLKLASTSDVPAGTGLGSSGSFTTALLKALHAHKRQSVTARDLAEQACHIELDRLGAPIGKQDQYIAALGGVTCLEFCQDGSVHYQPLKIAPENLAALSENLLLFFTGQTRSASAILKEQDDRTRKSDREMVDNLHYVKDLGFQNRRVLESGNLAEFGRLMDVHWRHKKKRSAGMSNPQIDAWYDCAMRNGATGGKLVGAGGGGFLMFYAEDANKLRRALLEQGLQETPFDFDFEGTRCISNE
jgi:D-glycero-alpha-D-manno-heptose-7-phosphate kinase